MLIKTAVMSPAIFLSALVLLCISDLSQTTISHSRREWIEQSSWRNTWRQRHSGDNHLDHNHQWGGWNAENVWRLKEWFNLWNRQHVWNGERGWNRDDTSKEGSKASYNNAGTTSNGNPVHIIFINTNAATAVSKGKIRGSKRNGKTRGRKRNGKTRASGRKAKTRSSGWNAIANSNGWTGLTVSTGWKESNGGKGWTENSGDGVWVKANGGSGWNAQRGSSRKSNATRKTKIRKIFARLVTIKLGPNDKVF